MYCVSVFCSVTKYSIISTVLEKVIQSSLLARAVELYRLVPATPRLITNETENIVQIPGAEPRRKQSDQQ